MSAQPVRRAPGADRILDAALALAGEMPWREVTMEMVASRAGATLDRVYDLYPAKSAFLRALVRRVDREVLKGHDSADSGEPVRERLLDVMLRRFDALRKHREAIRSFVRDPEAVLCMAPSLGNAMAWSLEAAGIGASGPAGMLRVKGLAAIFASSFRVWLRDETEDLSSTAASLDRNLRRAESLLRLLDRRGNA